MVRAAEILAVTELVLAHDRSAMPTAVDQSGNAAVGQSGNDDWVPPDIRGLVIAFFADFFAVAEIDPRFVENAFHLEIENFRIRIDRAMDRVLRDQFFNRGVHGSLS